MAVDSNDPLALPLVDPAGAPLGATPMLPRPEGAAAQRAHVMFARFVAEGRAFEPASAGAADVPGHPVAEPRVDDLAAGDTRKGPPSWLAPPAGPRQYSRALAVVEAAVRGETPSGVHEPTLDVAGPVLPEIPNEPLANEPAEPAHTQARDAHAPGSAAAELPLRPPPGVPVVRASAPASAPTVAGELDLSQRTDAGMFIQQPDGATAFEVELEDATLGKLTCRVTVREGRIAAAFVSPDVNTRRLLEAEAGRLRVRLEERGLRVDDVTVAAS